MLNTRLARLPTLAVFARRAYSGYPGTVRLPTLALFARRAYSDYPGTVAQSPGFNKREKAHEDQYVREKEKEELKVLREQLNMIREKVEELEKNGKSEDVKKDTEKK